LICLILSSFRDAFFLKERQKEKVIKE